MLALWDISCAFDGVAILRDIDLDIGKGEILCLLGPSGCGKTTLLRIIAGLEQRFTGDVLIDGKSVVDTLVHERGFGLMFQDFALFPHMNVAQNIAFGLQMRHQSKVDTDLRVGEALRIVGLTGFEDRDVSQLSGGEQQRVALARSLAPNPKLLMLDEPLGSLDAALREHLVMELRRIIKQVGLTTVYVTHDQQEAYAIADRIAIMNQGRIEQVDTPVRVFQQPQTSFVAGFLGLHNIIPVERALPDSVETSLGNFKVIGKPNAILIHPASIELIGSDHPDAIPGIVINKVFQGETHKITAQVGGGVSLIFYIPGFAGNIPEIGADIHLLIHRDGVIGLRD